MGIVGIVELGRPVHWGTFTEESTDCPSGLEKNRGCTRTGRWVSDDGTIVKENIKLDGTVDPGESVRAGYRPGGAWDDTNTVHTEHWVNGGAWVPFLGLVGTALLTWWQHRKWRRRPDDEALSTTSV
ncbi:hypothetical protein ACLM5J_06155 [Nocardioides sp. Bht2]|uniref:hypothetical protein n=1 Tax=Nocardioides sp. Bht2 TaxID=3392297 RepID=UPI0039B657B9